MLTKLRERMGREEGFTLVELLVVMLILGILAAIAIPSFFSQRDKARDAEAKTSVRTAQTAIETYAVDNGGSYAGATPALLENIEETLPATVTVTSTPDTYSVQVPSDAADNSFRINRAGTGDTTTTCGLKATLVTAPFPALASSTGGCTAGDPGTW